MSTQLTAHQDELTRWGNDPRTAMIQAAKEREQRKRETAAAAHAEIAKRQQVEDSERLRLAAIAAAAHEEAMQDLRQATFKPHPEPLKVHWHARAAVKMLATAFGVAEREIYGHRASPRALLSARHLSIYEVSRITGWTITKLGFHFDRDHSSIRFAVGKIKSFMASSPQAQQRILDLEERIDTFNQTGRQTVVHDPDLQAAFAALTPYS